MINSILYGDDRENIKKIINHIATKLSVKTDTGYKKCTKIKKIGENRKNCLQSPENCYIIAFALRNKRI